MWLRQMEEKLFLWLCRGSALLVFGSLFLLLFTIVARGLPALNLEMVIRTPKGGFYLGKEGGILNAIVGSLLLTGGATLLSLFVALPVAIYLNANSQKRYRFSRAVRLSLDVLWGIPSIVYGAFGYVIMVFMGIRASLLGGIVTVALLILPIMTRAMDEVIRMVPSGMVDASLALGATRLQTYVKVVVRQALPGVLSAILISFGRGIGDAASVLFTAGFSDRIPSSLFEPTATLPLAIFFQLGTPFPEVQQRAYASALVLTVLILLLSIGSRFLAGKYTKHVVK